jgi:hypothetical protein
VGSKEARGLQREWELKKVAISHVVQLHQEQVNIRRLIIGKPLNAQEHHQQPHRKEKHVKPFLISKIISRSFILLSVIQLTANLIAPLLLECQTFQPFIFNHFFIGGHKPNARRY